MRDVTSEPGLQGGVGFQQVRERGWGFSTETPEEVAGQLGFPGLGNQEQQAGWRRHVRVPEVDLVSDGGADGTGTGKKPSIGCFCLMFICFGCAGYTAAQALL